MIDAQGRGPQEQGTSDSQRQPGRPCASVGEIARQAMVHGWVEITVTADMGRQLLGALEAAQEWAAGYPLGGGMDETAAREVFTRCEAVLGENRPV